MNIDNITMRWDTFLLCSVPVASLCYVAAVLCRSNAAVVPDIHTWNYVWGYIGLRDTETRPILLTVKAVLQQWTTWESEGVLFFFNIKACRPVKIETPKEMISQNIGVIIPCRVWHVLCKPATQKPLPAHLQVATFRWAGRGFWDHRRLTLNVNVICIK